ncbi:uncharacterized protein [Henckelia pumila]|uniref:uncharacterized protein n=1 Tax=Henckelia pumila TaxID=405737 RepID=UPI003C6E9990
MANYRHCGAKKFEFESPTFCCDNGKIRLADTIIPCELFVLFIDTQSPEAENFRKRIRVYNSVFSFTYFGVKVDNNLASSNRGIYTFRVLGQVFHTLPPLTPREGKPSHFQLYFWDNDNELANRMSVFENADIYKDTMKVLMDVMKKNPYAEFVHKINDFPSIKDVTLQICKNAGVDQRCYNNPTPDQVAAIWIEGNNPNIPYDRDIILHGSDGQKHRIKHYFGCYDPLQYPLLFPSGENGWHQNIPKFKNESIVLQSLHTTKNPTNFSSVESILRPKEKGNEVGTVDEIKNFQDARWVSAQEALWQIFEFELNEISPAVINLALHFLNKHCVTFWRNQNLDYVLRQEHNSKTMLTEFFHTCSANAKARTLLYIEFPEYYVWDNQTKSWYERKKRRVIGRVNAANPIERERYYLRLLLSHVRGPISFDYLLMVNGKSYFTFKESAQKKGLLESDRSNFECMNEAVTFQMPHALRRLFATILVYCEAADVRLLWDTYFEAMSEDLKRQFHQNREFLVSKTLQSLNLILESMGKQIGAFDLPRISLDMRQSNATFSREIEEEKSIQISDDDYLAQFKLNAAQHEAFEKIQECVNLGNGGLFFVNGPGGTGKTFLYRALLANIRKKKHDCPSYSHFRSCSFNITRWSNSSLSL